MGTARRKRLGFRQALPKACVSGIKGTETLGNGPHQLRLTLENGFEADSGQFVVATSTRLFGREVSL